MIFHAYKTVKKKEFKKFLLKYIVRLIKKADIDRGKVRVAVVTFGRSAEILIHFDQYRKKKDLLKAIKKIPKNRRYNESNLDDALRKTRLELFGAHGRSSVKKYVVIITDASYNSVTNEVTTEAEKLKANNVTVHVLSVGVSNTLGLRSVASVPTKKHFYTAAGFASLRNYKRTGKPIVRRISACK